MGVFQDFTGKKFDKLTALSVKAFDDKRLKWLCICDCGNKLFVSSFNLTHKRQKSCGCSRRTSSTENSWKRLYSKYKYSARKRNLEFSLSYQKFKQICSLNCFYCGILPNKAFSCVKVKTNDNKDYVQKTTVHFNGLDRVNNEKGYTLKNIVPCCYECNLAKGSSDKKNFEAWLGRIVEYRMENR